MKPSATYFPGLDFLRFFAAFWVMGFHYFLGLSGELSWYRYGNLGVPLFFIISGFVISVSVAAKPLRQFALGRFIRLFPLFWIICTLTYIFTLLMPNGIPVRFPEYLISMTMLGDKLSSALGYGALVDPAYWSLTVELVFYGAIGLFVYFFSWQKIRYFLIGWLALSACTYLFHLDETFLAKLLLVRHASYFIFGATLALLASGVYHSTKQKMFDGTLLGIAALYSLFISYQALPPYMTPHPYDDHIVAGLHIVFFIVASGLVYYSKKFTSSGVVRFAIILGGITYPLYLLHQTIGTTLIDYFSYAASHAVVAATCMAFMIALSYLFYLFDKRMRRYLTIRLQAKD